MDMNVLNKKLVQSLNRLQESVAFESYDVIITFCEVNNTNGTSIFIRRMFPDNSRIITVRSNNLYDGKQQDFGYKNFCLDKDSNNYLELQIENFFQGIFPRRAILIPYKPEDFEIAVALRRQFDIPTCLYIMDDQNIYVKGIKDELIQCVVDFSDLCLGISPEMCDVYEKKFHKKFWCVPPLINSHICPQSYCPPPKERKGVLIGNIWSQGWLNKLRVLCSKAHIQIDWYGGRKYWLEFDEDELANDGINFKGFADEDDLIKELRQASFALIPTGTTDELDDRPELAKLSLPSRSSFLMGAASLPIIVVGSTESSVAKVVLKNNVGQVCDYDVEDFRSTLDELHNPDRQIVMRKNAFRLGQKLSVDGFSDWLWKSLAFKRPINGRFTEILETQTPEKFQRIIITGVEVNPDNEIGTLLKSFLSKNSDVISIYPQQPHGESHDSGRESYRLPYKDLSRREIYQDIINKFDKYEIDKAFCVPHNEESLLIAMAFKDIFAAKLGVYIMDNQNIVKNNISDELMKEVLSKSDVCFATHPELRAVYENKYNLKIWLLPSIIPDQFISEEASEISNVNLNQSKGALIGHIWRKSWFDNLCKTLAGSGQTLDWYGNNHYSWLNLTNEELINQGINPCGSISEKRLVNLLKSYPYVVFPYGTLDENDDNQHLTALGLPEKVIFNMAAANTPIILLGSQNSSVANFIKRFDIGVICDHDPQAFIEAVQKVIDPQQQRKMRSNAAKVAKYFSDTDIDDWVWKAVENGVVPDKRFELIQSQNELSKLNSGNPVIAESVPGNISSKYRNLYGVMTQLKNHRYYPDFILELNTSSRAWFDTVEMVFNDAKFWLLNSQDSQIKPSNYPEDKTYDYMAICQQFSELEPLFPDDNVLARKTATLNALVEFRNEFYSSNENGLLRFNFQSHYLYLQEVLNTLENFVVIIVNLPNSQNNKNNSMYSSLFTTLEDKGFVYYDNYTVPSPSKNGNIYEKEIVFTIPDSTDFF